jgi:hypothetical protein
VSVDIDRLARQLNWSEEDIENYEPEEPATIAAFELKDEVWIWAHDLEVLPGRTYQYRISVVVYNPLFARSLSLPESQRGLAKQVSLTSLPGDWTAPYQVRPPTATYVLRATAPGQGRGIAGPLGLGTAQVETYRFYDGSWHRSKQTVQPGDVVGVVEETEEGTSMDFATGWYVMDIMADPLASDDMAGSGRGALVLFGQRGAPDIAATRSPLVDREVIKPWVEEDAGDGELGG